MRKTAHRIVFICNPVYTYGKVGWSPYDQFLSGTEISIREWASRIKKLGFDVSVYYNGENTVYEGVPYEQYNDYVPGDLEINVKHLTFPHANPQNVWYLTNEMDIAEKSHIVDQFKGVILPSKWALDHLGYKGTVKIVPHGYDSSQVYPGKKIKKQCLYASSPDRGLDDLLNMWPEVVAREPEAFLVVTYGASRDVPNTIFLGQTDEETMNELYRTSDFWLYPCNGGELFCMTGIQAQAAQVIPVYYPTMALKETVREGIRTEPGHFVDDLIEIMNSPSDQRWIRHHLSAEHFADWDDSTEILLLSTGALNG